MPSPPRLSRLLLSRAAAIALRALVELARDPAVTLSGVELARRQQLPQPMLEQILLRLRRAGLVEARRGRHGGYRLAQKAETMPLALVLRAVEVPGSRSAEERVATGRVDARGPEAWAGDGAEDGARAEATDFGTTDLVSTDLGATELVATDLSATDLGASAGHRVEQQLRRRLERLVQQELERLTLAELLYDQRSWEASLGPEGGVML